MTPSRASPPATRGPPSSLHWLIAALFIGQFAWGWLMQEIPKSPPGMRADAFNFHKSIGLCLLGADAVPARLAHRASAAGAAGDARLAGAARAGRRTLRFTSR